MIEYGLSFSINNNYPNSILLFTPSLQPHSFIHSYPPFSPNSCNSQMETETTSPPIRHVILISAGASHSVALLCLESVG
ncbi:hypothetical protein Hanom_Chr10g00916901 [Helianthus anomalus]